MSQERGAEKFRDRQTDTERQTDTQRQTETEKAEYPLGQKGKVPQTT